jgi:hypothetical protein
MPGSKKQKKFQRQFWKKVKKLPVNTMTKEPYLDKKSANDTIRSILNTSKTMPSNAGMMGTQVPEPTINFIEQEGGKSIKNYNNRAAIVFGTDRPHVQSSGEGGKGSSGAYTIDIVAGRMACKDTEVDKGNIEAVNPNFACDAARIYVSQMTKVDLHFGLAPGVIGSKYQKGLSEQPRSAVAIKADSARIIGRNGVKIVSGRSFAFRGAGIKGETNARGGAIQEPAPPIELIAGNVTDSAYVFGGLRNPVELVYDLQGVARGDFTRDAIKELGYMFEMLIGVVDRVAILTEIDTALMGPSVWEPWRPPGATGLGISEVTSLNLAIWNIRIDKVLWEFNYLYDFGYKYLTSQNVFST